MSNYFNVAPGHSHLDAEGSSTYPSNSSFAFWEASLSAVHGVYHRTDLVPCHLHGELEVESASLSGPGDGYHHSESAAYAVGNRGLDEGMPDDAEVIHVLVWSVWEDSCQVETLTGTWTGTDDAYRHVWADSGYPSPLGCDVADVGWS